jgi:hypothetical protein
LKKFGKPIEKSKIENLATLHQLTPLVGFLAMAEKFWSTREITEIKGGFYIYFTGYLLMDLNTVIESI